MHDISVWNIQIMNEQILHDFLTKSWNVKFVMQYPYKKLNTTKIKDNQNANNKTLTKQ